MENPPFEDVFPIQDGDFPASYVRLPEGSGSFDPLAPSFELDRLHRSHRAISSAALEVGGSGPRG